MKKLVILALVIGMAGAVDVGAGTLSLEIYVDGVPYGGEDLAVGTTVDVWVVQDAYDPMGSGGEITVTMSASGGSATDTTPTCSIGPWVSSEPFCWNWLNNGGVQFFDNGDGTWWVYMGKVANLGAGTPGIGSCLQFFPFTCYESTMEFSFLTTETTQLVWGGTWDGVSYDGVVGGTVNVEPCACYGDVSGPSGVPDGVVSVSDLAAIVYLLAPYYDGEIGTPPLPVYPSGWECADVSSPTGVPDEMISTSDLAAIVGHLGPYSGTSPPYTAPCMPIP